MLSYRRWHQRAFHTSALVLRTGGSSKKQNVRFSVPLSVQPAARQLKSIRKAVADFPHQYSLKSRAKLLGIPSNQFAALSQQFASALLKGQRVNEGFGLEKLDRLFLQDIQSSVFEGVLLREFMQFIGNNSDPKVKARLDEISSLCDLRYPHEWYSSARSLNRKIILHVGPTNSGKTYQALKKLQEATSGMYCGPLRLLAHEIFQRFNAQNIPCDLLTGEERREVFLDGKSAPLVSCTVEMADFGRQVDVAVLDEIQMLQDRLRGWAWTLALLGLRARELHLCGEPSSIEIVERICDMMDEKVEVRHYERLSPLAISDEALNGDFSKVEPGDCLVAFSRKECFSIRKNIEMITKKKCSIIYGALPPEIRAEQAKLFNQSINPVLVATDAIGMGLNLNIRRIIFNSFEKFDGEAVKSVTDAHIRQIAGRAGRFQTVYDSGLVTTNYDFDLHTLRKAMASKHEPFQKAGLQPLTSTLERFVSQFPNRSYSSVLQLFFDMARTGDNYFLCNIETQKMIAKKIDHISLTASDRYNIITAPISSRDQIVLETAVDFAKAVSDNRTVLIKDYFGAAKDYASDLQALESKHRSILLYMWLYFKFPMRFCDMENAKLFKLECEALVEKALLSGRYKAYTKPIRSNNHFNDSFSTKQEARI